MVEAPFCCLGFDTLKMILHENLYLVLMAGISFSCT